MLVDRPSRSPVALRCRLLPCHSPLGFQELLKCQKPGALLRFEYHPSGRLQPNGTWGLADRRRGGLLPGYLLRWDACWAKSRPAPTLKAVVPRSMMSRRASDLSVRTIQATKQLNCCAVKSAKPQIVTARQVIPFRLRPLVPSAQAAGRRYWLGGY